MGIYPQDDGSCPLASFQVVSHYVPTNGRYIRVNPKHNNSAEDLDRFVSAIYPIINFHMAAYEMPHLGIKRISGEDARREMDIGIFESRIGK